MKLIFCEITLNINFCIQFYSTRIDLECKFMSRVTLANHDQVSYIEFD